VYPVWAVSMVVPERTAFSASKVRGLLLAEHDGAAWAPIANATAPHRSDLRVLTIVDVDQSSVVGVQPMSLATTRGWEVVGSDVTRTMGELNNHPV
jgi:hypothetical protein